MWGNSQREDVRRLTLEHAVRVYKEVTEVSGDGPDIVTLLATTLDCARTFARRVIQAVRAGTEAELFKRIRRSSAVGEDVIRELVEFLKLPRVSRCCPGESVSVGYGQRRVKFKLNVSKEAELQEFLTSQNYKYRVKTLMQYWPPNFITPGSNDRDRNVCPIHDSFPRLLQALHSSGVASNIPASCRSAAYLCQCPRGQEPTWSENCATGHCMDCPILPVKVRVEKC